jgi:hypothetical protein
MKTIPSNATRRQLLLALGVLPLAGLAQAAAPSLAKGGASVYQKYEGNNL